MKYRELLIIHKDKPKCIHLVCAIAEVNDEVQKTIATSVAA